MDICQIDISLDVCYNYLINFLNANHFLNNINTDYFPMLSILPNAGA